MIASTLTIRNLDLEVRHALQLRAKSHGRSMEAEARFILASAALPSSRPPLGDAMVAICRSHGITNDDMAQVLSVRDRAPANPMSFE